MTDAQVVVDTDRVDSAIVAELDAVCARAAVEVLPWRSLRSSQPILIVGSLRRGERQIPAPLLEAINRTSASATLLLLSDDPLVRSAIATHAGRVTLLARSASRGRIRGTIRMLLAHHGGFAHERLHGHVWTATFGAVASCARPALHHDEAGAVTAVIPFEAGWSGAEPLSVEAHRAACVQLDSDERRQVLRELFGSAAGMVHLSAGAREWTVYWPSATSSLLLCSPARLPSVYNLGDPADSQVLHLAASPGDVMIGLPSILLDRSRPDGLAVADGGAAILERIEELNDVRAMAGGVVVEIR